MREQNSDDWSSYRRRREALCQICSFGEESRPIVLYISYFRGRGICSTAESEVPLSSSCSYIKLLMLEQRATNIEDLLKDVTTSSQCAAAHDSEVYDYGAATTNNYIAYVQSLFPSIRVADTTDPSVTAMELPGITDMDAANKLSVIIVIVIPTTDD